MLLGMGIVSCTTDDLTTSETFTDDPGTEEFVDNSDGTGTSDDGSGDSEGDTGGQNGTLTPPPPSNNI